MKTKILAKAAGFVILSGWVSAFIGALIVAPPNPVGTFCVDFLWIWVFILSVALGIALLNYDS